MDIYLSLVLLPSRTDVSTTEVNDFTVADNPTRVLPATILSKISLAWPAKTCGSHNSDHASEHVKTRCAMVSGWSDCFLAKITELLEMVFANEERDGRWTRNTVR